MPTCILNTIPASKRAYFVKKQTTYPSGFGRSCPMCLDEPYYWVMRRPVNSHGIKDRFWGDKTKSIAGPFIGDAGKAKAEAIAKSRNESHHVAW